MQIVLRITSFYLILHLCFAWAGCNTTKHLEGDQAFLIQNEIDFVGDRKIRKKRQLREQLSRYFKQRPNGTTLLFVPKEHFYYKLQDTAGTSGFNRRLKQWQMRQFGEDPVIFDLEKTRETADAFRYFLQNQGYFDAEVDYYLDYRGKRNQKIIVTYEVRPEIRYTIGSVHFKCEDPHIDTLLQAVRSQSFLKTGEPVDQNLYAQEVNRITNFLRNNGYAFFQPAYVSELSGDSTGTTVNIELNVRSPLPDSLHQIYYVGDVNVFPGYDPTAPSPRVIDTLGTGIFFWSANGSYQVKPKILLNTLSLRQDSLFRQADYDRTYRQLNNLGVFRLVSIQEVRDTIHPDRLNFNIFLHPNDRFEFGADAEVNTSNSPFIGRLFGVSGGLSLRHRNLFRGAELFIANVEGGVALNLSNLDSLINTVDFTANANVYYPKFVDVFGVYGLIEKLGLFRNGFYDELQEKASTRLGIGYSFLERFNLYTINSFDATIGYDFRLSNRNRYRINHFKIDYYSPRTTFYFDTLILDKNPFLERSFDKQLFTGALLREFDFNYNTPSNRFGENYSVGTQLEFSGLELFGINALYNSITDRQDTFALRLPSDTIQFSQFIRGQVDLRYTKRFNTKQSVALRFYSGIAFPFGYGDNVPYVKQFFSGGAESIRAWSAREIGPGGYRDPLTLEDSTNPLLFYQSGEFKVEFNAEYRFHMMELFGLRFEGALFLDAGNVYTLRRDPDRPLSHLRWTPEYEVVDNQPVKVGDNFLKYFAVGTGFGIRLDVTYFMLRFDIGVPLRNPYPTTGPDGSVYYWRPLSEYKWSDLNFSNIGLGYPF